jgi:hypothetical protein
LGAIRLDFVIIPQHGGGAKVGAAGVDVWVVDLDIQQTKFPITWACTCCVTSGIDTIYIIINISERLSSLILQAELASQDKWIAYAESPLKFCAEDFRRESTIEGTC